MGDKPVDLIEVGPTQPNSDAIVYSSRDGIAWSGDVLSHPVIWEGPVSNWIAACDRLLGR
ncbi:MAG TPA: hypothetical protein VF331_11680 [Polyangiales bacterium]